jgi:matrixin
MRRSTLPSLGLVLLLAFGTAHAYSIESDGNGHPLHWASFPVSYFLVSGNNPAGTDGEHAVDAAFRTWMDAESAIDYRFAGYVAQGTVAIDGRNTVAWIGRDWPYDDTLAAITFRYYDSFDGHLIDVDIMFNGAAYDWSVGGSAFDIQNSATHETGHFGGLGHSTNRAAAMYATVEPGETSKRTLDADDVAGIQAIYGPVPTVLSTGPALGSQVVPALSSPASGSATDPFGTGAGGGGGGGGCSLADSAAHPRAIDFDLPLLLLGLLALRRRSCRRESRRRRFGRRA